MRVSKFLIIGSLFSFSFALTFTSTSCSKKNGVSNNRNDNNILHYLCNFTPKLISNDGTENKDNIISSTFAKNLINKYKCFNNNFLNELDQTFEKQSFIKKENTNYFNSEEKDITPSLGEIRIYYLNAKSRNIKKEIVFTINDNVLNKINTIENLNKMVKFRSFDKKVVTNTDKLQTKLFVNEENDQPLFCKVENNIESEIKNNEDIKKIKKIKINFSNKIPTNLNSNGFGGFLLTFNSLEGNKPITIAIKLLTEEEYKFFGDEDLYDKKLKNIFDNTIFFDKIGDKSLCEYVNINWLANENEQNCLNEKNFFNHFALRTNEQNIKWQLKHEPLDIFFLKKKRYYHHLNRYCRWKEKYRYKYYLNNDKQRNQLCCKYNTINVLCENNSTNDCLKLPQKYEGDECSYRLCFYKLFDGNGDSLLKSLEITTKASDKNNRQINLWTNENKPKYVEVKNNKIKKKDAFYEKINNEFCHYYEVTIPTINFIKNKITLNSKNKKMELEFYLIFDLKYKGINFYSHKIKIRYIDIQF